MSELILRPIGTIRTPFVDKYAAPRQPGADGVHTVGKVVLDHGNNFEQALSDLEGFEKIWLLYQFDRNSNWKPKVLPPRSNVKRGVFATRSPHRPNPIGLSLVSLLEIRGRTLIVEGVDMLDKTPLLDIKPYLPEIESFPNARNGWLDSIDTRDEAPRTFVYSTDAMTQLDGMAADEAQKIREHIERILRYEIAPHPYKRITKVGDGLFILAYKSWRIEFATDNHSNITIRALGRS